jgi:hypothetical protein
LFSRGYIIPLKGKFSFIISGYHCVSGVSVCRFSEH